MDIKVEINSNTLIVRYLNNSLTSIGRSTRQKINKGMALNNTLDQINLTDIYREHSIRKQQNTHSFQEHMDYSPE